MNNVSHSLMTVDDDGQAYITSRRLADAVDVKHLHTRRLVERYEADVKDFGELRRSEYLTKGRPSYEYLLNEGQALFLLTLMRNTELVVNFKEAFTIAFFKQRDTIAALVAQQKDPGWQNVRKDGKQVYFQKTDIIKDFVDYATAQGSKSAGMYYMNLAKMENSALFFVEQKYPNLREVLTIKQLMQVATADQVIEKALQEGMDKELSYKACFKRAKERIIAFADIIGQSPVLGLGQQIKLEKA